MSELLLRTLAILRRETRSISDLDFLESQMLLLNDLRQYIFDLSDEGKNLLYRALKLETYHEGETVFAKGDISNKLYVILDGKLDMLDVEGTKHFILIATLAPGKMIGERGLVRKTPRMLTAQAHSDCHLLTLDQASFKAVLEPAVYARMEEKLSFIERYVPSAKPLPMALKERLAYAFNMQYMHRGHKLLTQGGFMDRMYFIFYGECTVTEHKDLTLKNVVKLGPGCWFGEENVLLSRPSSYDVFVSGEYAWLYSLTRDDAFKLFPDATIETMKQQCVLKCNNRKVIAARAKILALEEEKPNEKLELFRFASSSAKRKLLRSARSHEHVLDSFLLRDEKNDDIRMRLFRQRDLGPGSPLATSRTSVPSSPRSLVSASSSRLRLKRLNLT